MADLIELYNQRKYGSSGIGSVFSPAIGVAETALSGVSSLASALPGLMYGVYEAVRTKDINKYPEAFRQTQEALTYQPRSVVGKEIEKAGGYIGEKTRQVRDWLGEKATGGAPAAGLVSAGLEMAEIAAGAVIPGIRQTIGRRRLAATQAARAVEHKSTLAALAAGEKFKLGTGEAPVYSKYPVPKELTVPAQETALHTMESKAEDARNNQAAVPLEDQASVEEDRMMAERYKKYQAAKVKPTVDDFNRVFKDDENSKTVRAVLRMASEEGMVRKPQQTEMERMSAPQATPTIKTIDEPSYEKVRNDSLIENPGSARPIEAKAPKTLSVDLFENRAKRRGTLGPERNLLEGALEKNLPALAVKPVRNIADIRTPQGYGRPEYLGEVDEEGNIAVASKGPSGRRVTGLGQTLEGALQHLQEQFDKAPVSKSVVHKIKTKPVAPMSVNALSETEVDKILKDVDSHYDSRAKVALEKDFPGLTETVRQTSGADIPQNPNLSPTNKIVEAKFAAKIKSNVDKAVSWYKAKHGNVIEVDAIREYSDDYAVSNETRALLTEAVHEPASWLGKEILKRSLAAPVAKDKLAKVTFTAGGTGAGKTGSLKNLSDIRDSIRDSDLMYDSNMEGFESGKRKIDQALASGRSVDIVYIYRDPVEAFKNGVLPRAEKEGRTIPLEAHVRTHLGSLKTIKELAEHYKDNSRVKIKVVDNSRGKGNAAISSLEELPEPKYDIDALRAKLYGTLNEERAGRKISEATYYGVGGELVKGGSVDLLEKSRSGGLQPNTVSSNGGKSERQRSEGLAGQKGGVNKLRNYQRLGGRETAQAARGEEIRDSIERLRHQLEFEGAEAEANKPMVLGTELNSGADIAKGVWYTLQTAKAKLKDAFLHPEPGVKVHETSDPAAQLRWRDWLISPSKVAQAQASFKELAGLGDRYIVDHNKLVMSSGRALDIADKILKKTEDSHINKESLDNLLLFGDVESKSFSAAELSEMGIGKEVQQAYRLIRKTLDTHHRLIDIARRRAGYPAVGLLKGYVTHNFKDWQILSGDKIIGSAATFAEALSRSNAAKRGGFAEDLHVVPRSYTKSQQGFSKVGDDSITKFEDSFIDQLKFSFDDVSSVSSPDMAVRYKKYQELLRKTGVSRVTDKVDTSLREYLNNSARYIASSRFKTDASKAFKKTYGEDLKADFPKSSVAYYAKNYINDITGGQVYIDQLINDMFHGSQSTFGKFVGKHMGKDVLEGASKFGGGAANLAYIAANISSALLNYVSGIYGGAIVGHTRLSKTWALTKLKPEMAAHKAKIMQQIGVAKYSPQLDAFPGSELTKTGLLNKVLYKGFSVADYDVKSNIGYAAYLKAREEGAPHTQALKYAREVVVRSVGEMAYSEAPAAVRLAGKVGRPFWQMKRTLHKGIENAIAFRGKEALRFWGPFLVLAGYQGIPHIQDISNLISWATGGEVEPELAMKETLTTWAKDNEDKEGVARLVNIGSKVAQYGVGQYAGIDIGRRIGLGDLVSSLGRPAFNSVVSDVWKPMMEGDWADAAFKLVPRSVTKAMQYFFARNELFESPYDRSRKTLTDPTWVEQLTKAIGVTPVRERQVIEASQIETHHKKAQQKAETELIDDYIRAKDKNDKALMDTIRQRAVEAGVHSFMKRVMFEDRKKNEGKMARVKRSTDRRHSPVQSTPLR